MTLPFDYNNEDQHEDEPEKQQEDEDLLTLQLFTGNTSTKSPHQSRLQTSTHADDLHATSTMTSSPQTAQSSILFAPCTRTTSVSNSFRPSSSSNRSRRSSGQLLRDGKTEHITPPYEWATTKRAVVCSLRSLHSKDIDTISGQVQCKKCNATYELEFDLNQKLQQVASYVSRNRSTMRDRAPRVWMSPRLPDCKLCGVADCVKPLMMEKKRSINWLFLLLGQMLGLCKLSQLKYFCKHTNNHRTGAKDRVLYLTYLELLKQLDPSGPFDA